VSLECGVCERDIRADVDHSECKAEIARQRAERGVVSDQAIDMWGSERDRLLAENQALREALTWALEEGGWRLWYYAAKPVPAIIETGSIGDPARIKKG